MKLIIEIPKNFVSHWKKDKFKDSLERILADIAQYRFDHRVTMSGKYEEETLEMLIEAFNNSEKPTSMYISDILWSLWYNRDVDELINLCDELLKRINKTDGYFEWSDDANIVFGAMIHAYGDYGVSPRAGWFTDEQAKKECIEEIEEFRAEMMRVKERGDE